VLVNLSNETGVTPFWLAASGGHGDIVKWMIASGREVHLGQAVTSLEPPAGKKRNKKVDEMLSLLGQFRENQESTTAKVRAALGIASTVIPHTHTFSTISPRTYGSHQIRHGHIHCSNRR